MLFYSIISQKQKDRVNEILKTLQDMNKKLPNEDDRIAVLRELSGFERIANQQQKKEACEYLQKISNNLQPNHVNYVQKLIARINK